MHVRFGKGVLDYPSERLGELRDANELIGDVSKLRERLAEDGYLLLRDFLPREDVEAARGRILAYMDEQQALTPGEAVLDGVMPKDGKSVSLMGRAEITHNSEVRRVLEAPALFSFFEGLFDSQALTYDYKWLRAVGNEGYTGSHFDVVYMGRGSKRVHTVWIPFGDIPVEQGTLAMCVGSHRLPGFSKLRDTYGAMDVDRDRVQGWFSSDPNEILDTFGGHWATTNYRMGDVILFGLYTMHASTTNTTNRFRLSCDVRYQPANEPVDERWVGDTPRGHYRVQTGPMKEMAEARREWGV